MNTPPLLTVTEQRDELKRCLKELILNLQDAEEDDHPDVDEALDVLARCDLGTAPLVVDIEVRGGVVHVATWPASVEVRIVDHDNDSDGRAR